MKSGRSNKPAKTLKDWGKLFKGGRKKGKHHNRPGSFSGFGNSIGGRKSHIGKKDNLIIGVIIGIIGLVIISVIICLIVAKIKRQRAMRRKNGALGSLSKDVQDIENGDESDSNPQERVIKENSIGVAVGSDNSYGEEKSKYVIGEALVPPTGNWGESDYTLSAGTAATRSGSVGCSNCAQNGSTATGCGSCADSTSQTPITAATPEVIPEVAPSSPMTMLLPSTLPEVASTGPFVDAEETIGLADGGPDVGTPKTELTDSGCPVLKLNGL
ncbi:hypothetical protein TWF730_010075 [Orbilia blumenaviensis]|uniref:Uncharacterized protein n=1 Tax=Orbilia blumenaviensis TaxID=1796055 RepID=A0AAV9UX28_9PEZI